MMCAICHHTKLRYGACCAKEISWLKHHVENQSRELERYEAELRRSQTALADAQAAIEGLRSILAVAEAEQRV